MSGPSSRGATARTTYTPDAARRALPLLSAIATDAHMTYVRLRGRLRALDEKRPLEELTSDALLPQDLRDELETLRDHMRELDELGARLGDPELGIVLLDAVVDGRPGSLCWKIGEASIRFWFPLGEGYEQRRPLATP